MSVTQHLQISLAEAFARSKMVDATPIWNRSSVWLDDWRDSWIRNSTLLCPANRDALGLPELDLAQTEQSRACLQELRVYVSTLLEIWHKPTDQQILDAQHTLQQITPPEDCLDIQKLSDRSPLPTDPEKRQKTIDLLTQLERAQTFLDQGEYHRANQLLNTVSGNIASTADPLLLAKHFGILNRPMSIHYLGTREAQLTTSKFLIWSIASNQPTLSSIAAESQWFHRVYVDGSYEECHELFSEHLSYIARADNPFLMGDFEGNQGIWAAIEGNLDESEAHFLRQVDLVETTGSCQEVWCQLVNSLVSSRGRSSC